MEPKIDEGMYKGLEKCKSCGLPLFDEEMKGDDKGHCKYCVNTATGKLRDYEEIKDGLIQLWLHRHGGTGRREAEKEVEKMLKELPEWKGKA